MSALNSSIAGAQVLEEELDVRLEPDTDTWLVEGTDSCLIAEAAVGKVMAGVGEAMACVEEVMAGVGEFMAGVGEFMVT